MKIKDSVEQITLDLFQNCDVPEEVSGTFDPEVDLNDDAVGRSRYERFYSVRSNYARENLSLRRRSRDPVEWNAFEGTVSRVKLRRLTRQRISKNVPKSSKIPVELMYFVMLSNAFRQRPCKHESKRKSYESGERWFNNPSLRKTCKPKECQK